MTAREYVLTVLQQYPENELSVSDLFEWQSNLLDRQDDTKQFSKNNLHNALARLETDGRIVRAEDPIEKRSYWAIKL